MPDLTERGALARLASVVAEVAQRSWEALGTDTAAAVTAECAEVAAAMGEDVVVEETVVLHPRDDGPKAYYGPPVELLLMSDRSVRWRYDS